MTGNYRFRLEGSEESLSRQQERSEKLQLLQALAQFAGSPAGQHINYDEVFKQVASAFDIQPPELILAPPPPALPQGAPAPGGQQPPNGVGFGQPPLMNGQMLPAVVQQAVTGR